MESEQVTPMDSIKDVVQSSMKVPEFDKHLKKARGHIGRNIVEITIKMKTIVWKPLMIIIQISVLISIQVKQIIEMCDKSKYEWSLECF